MNSEKVNETTVEVIETTSQEGKVTRTCSGKCGNTKVGPINCPPGHSPILDCTSNPPTITCYDHRNTPFSSEQIQYLSTAVAEHLRGNEPTVRNTIRGVARVLGDDCTKFTFEVNGNQYSFDKAGHDSWVETIKYSKRNNTNIDVIDNGIRNSDGKLKPLEIYDS